MANLCSKCLCRPACESWCDHANSIARLCDESNRRVMEVLNPDKVSELAPVIMIKLNFTDCPHFVSKEKNDV